MGDVWAWALFFFTLISLVVMLVYQVFYIFMLYIIYRFEIVDEKFDFQ